ncbi:MAG TPA: GNAT family N-acetyltransferase [Microvirga sp.]|nr:GNAT family N-acetyltransferase [Microvirga sp.]
MTGSVAIRPATEDDVAFVMATERRPGFERLVGRSEEAQHRAELRSPGSAYLIGERDGAPRGFAILRGLDDPFGNIYLKRIAVREPGTGFGQAFLQAVIAWSFARPQTHRFWLDVFLHNERARHLYRKVGLREDGILREAYVTADGTRHSQALMSILRPEWEALHPSGNS